MGAPQGHLSSSSSMCCHALTGAQPHSSACVRSGGGGVQRSSSSRGPRAQAAQGGGAADQHEALADRVPTKQQAQQLDIKFLRMLAMNSLPFSLADNAYFLDYIKALRLSYADMGIGAQSHPACDRVQPCIVAANSPSQQP
jgi:hypothetical protein